MYQVCDVTGSRSDAIERKDESRDRAEVADTEEDHLVGNLLQARHDVVEPLLEPPDGHEPHDVVGANGDDRHVPLPLERLRELVLHDVESLGASLGQARELDVVPGGEMANHEPRPGGVCVVDARSGHGAVTEDHEAQRWKVGVTRHT